MTDLRAACIHGRYEAHEYRIGDPEAVRTWRMKQCFGGRDITIPDGEMTWLRVVGMDPHQKTYVLKPGGDPAGGDDQWEEVVAAIGDGDD